VGTFSYKLDRLLLTQHSFSVTLFTLGFRLFFYSAANKPPDLLHSSSVKIFTFGFHFLRIFSLANAGYYSHRFVQRSFIPLPRSFKSRRVTPFLNQSLVLIPPQSVEVAHDVRHVESFLGLLWIIVLV
jgi:hypothetical protein